MSIYKEYGAAVRMECGYCECACYSCKHFVKGTETECDLPEGKCQNESEYEPIKEDE